MRGFIPITLEQQAFISAHSDDFAALSGLELSFPAMDNPDTFTLIVGNGRKIKRLNDLDETITPEVIATLDGKVSALLLDCIDETCNILRDDKKTSFEALAGLNHSFLVQILKTQPLHSNSISVLLKNGFTVSELYTLSTSQAGLSTLVLGYSARIVEMLDAGFSREFILGKPEYDRYNLSYLIEDVPAFIRLINAGYSFETLTDHDSKTLTAHLNNASALASIPRHIYDALMQTSHPDIRNTLFWNARTIATLCNNKPEICAELTKITDNNKLKLLIKHPLAAAKLIHQWLEQEDSTLNERLNTCPLATLETALEHKINLPNEVSQIKQLNGSKMAEKAERKAFLIERFYHIDTLETERKKALGHKRIHSSGRSVGSEIESKVRATRGRDYTHFITDSLTDSVTSEVLMPDLNDLVMSELNKLPTEPLKLLLTSPCYPILRACIRHGLIDFTSTSSLSLDDILKHAKQIHDKSSGDYLENKETLIAATRQVVPSLSVSHPATPAKESTRKPNVLFIGLSLIAGVLGAGGGATLIAIPVLTQLMAAGAPSTLSILLGAALLVATITAELFLAPKAMGHRATALFCRHFPQEKNTESQVVDLGKK